MSSSSSSPHRRRHKKKKKHHHHNDSDGGLASKLKEIRDDIFSSINTLRTDMKDISERVDNVEKHARERNSSPPEQSLHTNPTAWEVTAGQSPTVVAEQSSTPANSQQRETGDTEVPSREPMPLPDNAWADRTIDGTPDYDEIIFWQPDDSDASEGETTKLFTTTTKIVEDAFACSMANEKRRSLKRKQPVPDTPYTKCPKLDSTIQSRLLKSAKDADRASARIQTLVLDAAAPLINILESARKGTLNTKEAAETAQQALKLLGNASANISMGRRHKATQHLNTELVTLLDDEQSFKDAAPLLFGKTFDQRARDHIEAVKSLKKTSFYKGQSFQRGHPPSSRGGGNSSRGRRSTFRKPSFPPKKKTQ